MYTVKPAGKTGVEVHETFPGNYQAANRPTVNRVIFDTCSECQNLLGRGSIVSFEIDGENGIACVGCVPPGSRITHEGSLEAGRLERPPSARPA
jgi:hypothetical protein